MENMDIFIVVVEQSSLNKAAKVLNISQPALSRKMMRLEEDLGVELFYRKGKRLELTRAGQICYEHALDVRRMDRKLEQALSAYKSDQPPDSFTIGASLTTLTSTLPDLISAYTREHPHTDIKAITGKTHEIVTFVREKKVDIGLVASKIEHPGLTCIPLFDDHLCLVIPSHHPLASKKKQEMSDLHDLPMILFSRGTWYRILMDELFHRFALHPDVKMEIDSFEAIIRLLSPCGAATLLPESYLTARIAEDNDLRICRIPALEETKRTTSLVFADEAREQPSIRLLIEQAVQYYRKRPENET